MKIEESCVIRHLTEFDISIFQGYLPEIVNLVFPDAWHELSMR